MLFGDLNLPCFLFKIIQPGKAIGNMQCHLFQINFVVHETKL